MDEKNKMVISNIIVWDFLDDEILFYLENYTFYLKIFILFNINKQLK